MTQTAALSALHDIARDGLSGELVVQTKSSAGRIFFVNGRIAWAFSQRSKEHLGHSLAREGLVSREDYGVVLAECKRQGINVCETMIAWGLVGREAMRQHLRLYVARNISMIFGNGPTSAVFVREQRAYQSDLTFDVEELERITRLTRPVTSEDPAGTTVSNLEAVMAIGGALGTALVNVDTGECLGTLGDPGFDLDVAARGNCHVVKAKLATLRDLGLSDHESIEDILITLGAQYHLVRLLEGGRSFLYLVLDRARGNLGLARLKLRDVERRLQPVDDLVALQA